MCREERARCRRLRTKPCSREFFAHGAFVSPEDNIEDRQYVCKIPIVMFRLNRVMNTMDLRCDKDVIKPRQLNADRRVVKQSQADQKHSGIQRSLPRFSQIQIYENAQCEEKKARQLFCKK